MLRWVPTVCVLVDRRGIKSAYCMTISAIWDTVNITKVGTMSWCFDSRSKSALIAVVINSEQFIYYRPLLNEGFVINWCQKRVFDDDDESKVVFDFWSVFCQWKTKQFQLIQRLAGTNWQSKIKIKMFFVAYL